MQCRWNYETMIADQDLHILYYALAVAKRKEIGLNYRFLCIAVPKDNTECASHLAIVGVYKPPAGKPYGTCLYRKDFDQLFPD